MYVRDMYVHTTTTTTLLHFTPGVLWPPGQEVFGALRKQPSSSLERRDMAKGAILEVGFNIISCMSFAAVLEQHNADVCLCE